MYDDIDDGDEDLGPIDYVVVELGPGAKGFGDALAREVALLVDAELVRILDLVLVEKDRDGRIQVVEFEDLRDPGVLRALDGRLAEVLAFEDLANVAAAMDPGATGAVFVWENTWAAPFAAAARESGGQVVAGGRIPTQAVVAALTTETEGA
jgi:hypothetical protein